MKQHLLVLKFLYFTCLLVFTANSSAQTVIHFTLAAPPVLTASAGTDVTMCAGGPALQLNVSPSGGTGSYNYAWYPSAGLDTNNVSNPLASPDSTTTYTVTVFDSYGCSVTDSIQVTVELCTGVSDLSAGAGSFFHVYPNPGNSIFNLSVEKIPTQEVVVEIMNAAGNVVYTKNISSQKNSSHFALDLSDQVKGFYFVHLKAAGLNRYSKLIIN